MKKEVILEAIKDIYDELIEGGVLIENPDITRKEFLIKGLLKRGFTRRDIRYLDDYLEDCVDEYG